MKLVTRYVVREHVGPLLFALSALTSLLMLQYVARQLANLAGKGLPWKAIAQFFVLSLPFTIAMTLPMAVLVATLHAFGRMAAEHEITAFKASGVRVRALMMPVAFCALLLSLAMVAFNDQVLPRANHQLRQLQTDIARTKPTLALRDQVLNAVTDQFYIRVSRTNAATNKMYDVVLYDLTQGQASRKTVYADSGLFLLAPNQKDLQLVLYDGVSQEFVKNDAKRFQRNFFREQVVQVRGISQAFEESTGDTYRGDREMSICEMQRKYRVSALEFRRIRQDFISYAKNMTTATGQKTAVPRDRPAREALGEFYCVTLPSLFRPKTAQAQGVKGGVEWKDAEQLTLQVAQQAGQQAGQPSGQPPAGQAQAAQPPAGQPPVTPPQTAQPPQTGKPPVSQPGRGAMPAPRVDRKGRKIVDAPPPTVQQQNQSTAPAPKPGQSPVPQTTSPVATPQGGAMPPATATNDPYVLPQNKSVPLFPADSFQRVPRNTVAPLNAPPPPAPSSGSPANMDLNTGSLFAATQQLLQSRESLDSLAVEIHKKFALSFACLVFVLFGPPIALRFPRGGVGVTLGVSIVVFGLYYICLMAGEALADKGRLPAFVAMWIANAIFTVAGIFLLWRVESTVDSSRGGGLREWWGDRKVRRALKREMALERKAVIA